VKKNKIKMGAVCSAGMTEGNAELEGGGKTLGFSGKLMKKEKSFTNRKETFSDSRSNSQSRKQNNKQNGVSDEFGLSTSASIGEKQVLFFFLFFLCLYSSMMRVIWFLSIEFVFVLLVITS
jgi:hypothetical protein